MGLRIAIFGQAPFGRDVALRLVEAGHALVAVHAPPDDSAQGGRADPLAAEAEARGWPLFRHRYYRRKGAAKPELVEEYLGHGAELNVLAFTTAFLPPEIVDAPRFGSICFHPSLLPAYRGGNALAWQIILGAEESGVSIFKPDAGVDTGPIVVQKGGAPISELDTSASLYFDKLYGLGVDAIVEAVEAIADGSATFATQTEEGASHQGLVDDEVAHIDFSRSAEVVDRLVRGCDPQPGAWAEHERGVVRLFGSRLVEVGHRALPGTVLGEGDEGRLLVALQGARALAIAKLRVADGKKLAALEAGLGSGERLV
ncbi:MAG: methionyl-tRNA formyltransferase [Deltaproteobacteria bacterium]|nr:methionyl-tRNA formyltransferase [Deltaproteobacteria bacterium]